MAANEMEEQSQLLRFISERLNECISGGRPRARLFAPEVNYSENEVGTHSEKHQLHSYRPSNSERWNSQQYMHINCHRAYVKWHSAYFIIAGWRIEHRGIKFIALLINFFRDDITLNRFPNPPPGTFAEATSHYAIIVPG